jgi:hypothetical protein
METLKCNSVKIVGGSKLMISGRVFLFGKEVPRYVEKLSAVCPIMGDFYILLYMYVAYAQCPIGPYTYSTCTRPPTTIGTRSAALRIILGN